MRVIRTTRKSKRRALLVVLSIAAALFLGLLAVLQSEDVVVPTKQNFEGTLELIHESSLDLSFTSMTVSGSISPFAPSYIRTGFLWEGNDLGYFTRLYFVTEELPMSVYVSDPNGTLGEFNASDFRLDYWSLRDCSSIYIGDSEFKASMVHQLARIRITDVSRGSPFLPLSFDALRGNEYLKMDFNVLHASEDSRVFLTCEHPDVTISGQSLHFNGTTYFRIEAFGDVGGSLSLGPGSVVQVIGDMRISLSDSRILGQKLEGSLSSPFENYELNGDLTVVDASQASIHVDRDQFDYGYPVETMRMDVLLEGSVVFSEVSGHLQPTTSQTKHINLVSLDDTWRDVLAILLSLSLGILIYWLADDLKAWLLRREPSPKSKDLGIKNLDRLKAYIKHRKMRRPCRRRSWLSRVLVIVVVVILCLSVYYAVVWVAVGSKPIPYYYERYNVELEVFYEEGVDLEKVRVATDLFEVQLEYLLDISVTEIHWKSFEDDGVEVYSTKEETWRNIGFRKYDTVAIATTGLLTYGIAFKKGSGAGFAGINSYGPSTVIPVDQIDSPVELLETLMHEIGHALMLEHNPCSPLMSVSSETSGTTLPSHITTSEGTILQGVHVFGEAKNGTFVGFDDWGDEIARLLNKTEVREDLNRTFMRNMYVYLDADGNEIHEVVYLKSIDHAGNDTWDTAWIQRVPGSAYSFSLSVGEYIYLLQGLAGYSRPAEALKYFC